MTSALSTLKTTTEMPLSKAPNPPLLRVCVHGVCVFTAVCVHFGWVKRRAQIPSMGYHTSLYVTSLSLFSLSLTYISFLCGLRKQMQLYIFFPVCYGKDTEYHIL